MTKMPVDTLARAMVTDALKQLKKEKSDDRYHHILSNHQIFDLAKEYKMSLETGPEVAVSNEKGEGNVETQKEPKVEDGLVDKGKCDEGEAIEGKSDEGTSDQGACKEPKTSESDEGAVLGDQQKESEGQDEGTVEDVAKEVDQTAKENNQAE